MRMKIVAGLCGALSLVMAVLAGMFLGAYGQQKGWLNLKTDEWSLVPMFVFMCVTGSIVMSIFEFVAYAFARGWVGKSPVPVRALGIVALVLGSFALTGCATMGERMGDTVAEICFDKPPQNGHIEGRVNTLGGSLNTWYTKEVGIQHCTNLILHDRVTTITVSENYLDGQVMHVSVRKVLAGGILSLRTNVAD